MPPKLDKDYDRKKKKQVTCRVCQKQLLYGNYKQHLATKHPGEDTEDTRTGVQVGTL